MTNCLTWKNKKPSNR